MRIVEETLESRCLPACQSQIGLALAERCQLRLGQGQLPKLTVRE